MNEDELIKLMYMNDFPQNKYIHWKKFQRNIPHRYMTQFQNCRSFFLNPYFYIY